MIFPLPLHPFPPCLLSLPARVLNLPTGQVARAMAYLHEKGICHGDLYAHNVLVDGGTGAAVLCDFGASFFYPSERHKQQSFALEGLEVRAFGLMARDMARRSSRCQWILQVCVRCACVLSRLFT